ncbi:response regulator transcription factor [Rhizobium leguminosarum]|uniref:response regulator n=1 Tax=Rhizobium leguminosarum TaxID=384 RepID=UPI001031364E|nr:response regulator transcription factor [Rhizobium leguminosarum]MBY2925588.1 response regulator transcription factor [Rhizobium leguminosarum]MBY2936176.1 response regulator transcription factor [Rhizobium leguminosarum]TAZ45275.1 response regulator transcription factor [Rhizobium leguminosarum]
MSNPVSVAFIDDHPILLEGLVSLYSGKPDLNIVGQGENAVDALKIVSDLDPDVVVVDLSMPGDAIAAIEILAHDYPRTRILVFTATSSIETAIHVLNLGVAGYVLKGCTAFDLHQAIKTVHAGGTFITPGFATKVIMSMKSAELRHKTERVTRLSTREEQIIRHLMRGSTNREIATSLDISEKTVKHYMTVLMQKLDARNRVEVVLAAQKLNMLSGPATGNGLQANLN